MFPDKYTYLIEYLVADDNGRHKEKKDIAFTKPKESWKYADYTKLEQYLAGTHKGRADVNILSISEVKK